LTGAGVDSENYKVDFADFKAYHEMVMQMVKQTEAELSKEYGLSSRTSLMDRMTSVLEKQAKDAQIRFLK